MADSKLKVLHVSTNDVQGGAARSAYRVHKSLQMNGVDSKMLVMRKHSDDHSVLSDDSKFSNLSKKLRPHIDQIPIKLYKNKAKTLFSASWLPFGPLSEKINQINPDIVNLHWVASGMFRIEELRKIKQPIVWTLHDMLPFTGGCHYDSECGKYSGICKECPVLNSGKEKDLSSRVFKRKVKTYESIKNLTIIGASSWLTNCAKESALFRDYRIENLPTPIDAGLYKPVDKDFAKEIFGLPKSKKVVLYGAVNATGDPRKGFAELSSALKCINVKDFELAVFGSSKPENCPSFGFPTHYLGHLSDDISLVLLYNAADVMVVPSIQENLSNVILESLACGTPVVSFNIGGNPDMIDHQQNGYLAKPYSPADLAKGIEWVIEHPNPELLRDNARQKVIKGFEMIQVAKRYESLYEEILARQ